MSFINVESLKFEIMCCEINLSYIDKCPEPPRAMEAVKLHAEMSEDEYAYGALEQIRKQYRHDRGIYMDFLHDVFSGETIEAAEQVALNEFRKTHRYYVKILKGFEENGKIFYLDRQEKVLFALYEKRRYEDRPGGGSSAIAHYNPNRVDVIEQAVPDFVFFERIDSGRYNVGTDEEALISELWDIIFKENTKT